MSNQEESKDFSSESRNYQMTEMNLTISPLKFPSISGDYRFISRDHIDGLLLRIEKIKTPYSWELIVSDLSQHGSVNLPEIAVFEGLKEALIEQNKASAPPMDCSYKDKISYINSYKELSQDLLGSEKIAAAEVVSSEDSWNYSPALSSVDLAAGEFHTLVLHLSVPVVKTSVRFSFTLEPVLSEDAWSVLETTLHDIEDDNHAIKASIMHFKNIVSDEQQALRASVVDAKKESFQEVQLLKAELFSVTRQMHELCHAMHYEIAAMKQRSIFQLHVVRLRSSPNICPKKVSEIHYAIPWQQISEISDKAVFSLSEDTLTVTIRGDGLYHVVCFADNVLEGFYQRDSAVYDVKADTVLGGDSTYLRVKGELAIAIVNTNYGDTCGIESIGNFSYYLTIVKVA